MRTYKGWTIEKMHPSGMWRGFTIFHGYYKELKADTLQGLKDFITYTIEEGDNNA